MAWNWDSFINLGFTEEQVSILKENVALTQNEISKDVKLNEILSEIRKHTTLDDEVVYSVDKKKINEADKDEEDETEDATADETEDATADETEDATADETEDATTDETEDVTAEEDFTDDLSDDEDVTAEEDFTDDLSDEEDVTAEEDFTDDLSDEEESDDLEDDTEEDEETESYDNDDINQSNVDYSQGNQVGLYDRGYADGYNDAFNDRVIYDSIVNENKEMIAKAEKLNEQAKTEVKQPVKTEVKQPVKTEVKQPVKTEVKQPVKTEVKQPVKPEVKQPVKPEVKPKVTIKENKLSDKELRLQNIFEEIELPIPEYGFQSEILNEKLELEKNRKQNVINKFLNSMTPLKQAEIKPLLEEMSRKVQTAKDLQDMISLMPVTNVVTKDSKLNESIEGKESIYNSNKSNDDLIRKNSIDIFNRLGEI